MRKVVQEVANKLIENELSISFAESMTGGSLASQLTKCAGVSKIFKGSFVTYSDEYKMRVLGVPEDKIKENGLVSVEICKQMIIGLSNLSDADILISVTGNAGPTTNDDLAPVGRVYVGFVFKDQFLVKELNFNGTREQIIDKTVNFIYDLLNKLLTKK